MLFALLIVAFCLLLITPILGLVFGLVAGVIGLVVKIICSVLGFGMKFTFKAVLAVMLILCLLSWIF